MNANSLREKNTQQLQEELVNLLKQKFSINLNRETGNKKAIRRDIARIKTVISERQQEK
jgi:large subunit ribosomal protein L29